MKVTINKILTVALFVVGVVFIIMTFTPLVQTYPVTYRLIRGITLLLAGISLYRMSK